MGHQPCPSTRSTQTIQEDAPETTKSLRGDKTPTRQNRQEIRHENRRRHLAIKVGPAISNKPSEAKVDSERHQRTSRQRRNRTLVFAIRLTCRRRDPEGQTPVLHRPPTGEQ